MAPAPDTFSPSPMVLAPPLKVTSYGHWVESESGKGESRTVISSPGSSLVLAVSVVVCSLHSRQKMEDQRAVGKLSVLGQGNQLLPGGVHAALSVDNREPADLAPRPVCMSMRAGSGSPADRPVGGGAGVARTAGVSQHGPHGRLIMTVNPWRIIVHVLLLIALLVAIRVGSGQPAQDETSRATCF
eukprot:9495487-Pyramimonas_sp.AAC.1